MKSREDASMIAVFTSICSNLEAKGHTPELHVLNNKCSRAVHTFLEGQGAVRQTVEAHIHSTNATKPAVKTTKYHVISHIDTLDVNCPIQLWAKMLPQTKNTIKMFHTSHNNNAHTAYKELKGKFN